MKKAEDPACRRWVRPAFLAMAMAASGWVAGPVAANPLQALHELALSQARQDGAAAKTADDRRAALTLEVSALNSLGRSDAALQRLDEAALAAPSSRPDAELRAKVLLPLGRCDEAVPMLQADIAARDAAAKSVLGAAHQPGGPLFLGAEALLALVYCDTANRRWDAATAALARVFDPMDPSLSHYTAAWYAALRKLGAVENARLDAVSKQLTARGGTHAISLAVAQGRIDLQQAQRDLQRLRQTAADAQDALAEVLFFAAVAADSPQSRAGALAQLDALAPFGSSEWVLAKLLFPSR